MQDRFKFRAKLKDMDNWIYGAYLKMLPYQPYPVGNVKPLKTEYKHLIIVEGSADWGMPRGIAAYEVIPETVGQCTGLKDKNDKLIYEGDIVKFKNTDNKYYIGTIKYTDEDVLFCLNYRNANNRDDWDYVSRYRLEVIGNIYENPELLEDKR